tara:strand:+ start:1106 stop:1342 length:237 start_codon:yes stop_codon:yes gene_type:complete
MAIIEKTEHGVTYNETTKNMSWTLVHDGLKVIMFDKTDSQIGSIHSIEEFNTKQKGVDKIKELGLEYTPIEEEENEQF